MTTKPVQDAVDMAAREGQRLRAAATVPWRLAERAQDTESGHVATCEYCEPNETRYDEGGREMLCGDALALAADTNRRIDLAIRLDAARDALYRVTGGRRGPRECGRSAHHQDECCPKDQRQRLGL